jgi:hypothetical protein
MANVTRQTIKSYKIIKLGKLKRIEINGDLNNAVLVNTVEVHPSKSKVSYDITLMLYQTLSKISATIFDPNIVVTKKEVKMDNLVK